MKLAISLFLACVEAVYAQQSAWGQCKIHDGLELLMSDSLTAFPRRWHRLDWRHYLRERLHMLRTKCLLFAMHPRDR